MPSTAVPRPRTAEPTCSCSYGIISATGFEIRVVNLRSCINLVFVINVSGTISLTLAALLRHHLCQLSKISKSPSANDGNYRVSLWFGKRCVWVSDSVHDGGCSCCNFTPKLCTEWSFHVFPALSRVNTVTRVLFQNIAFKIYITWKKAFQVKQHHRRVFWTAVGVGGRRAETRCVWKQDVCCHDAA